MKDTVYIKSVNVSVKKKLEKLHQDVELLTKTIITICKILKATTNIKEVN